MELVAWRDRVSIPALPRVRVPWATLLLAVAISALFVAGELSPGFGVHFIARSIAVKGLTAIEPERLFASSLVHSSPSHLYWNLGGLLFAGGLVESALGRAVVLNVALWGGLCGVIACLPALEAMQSGGGASGMVFALIGAFLTWRALTPAAFGPLHRNALLWVLLLLWAAAVLASNEPLQGRFHLAGFAYGIGWGLFGPRFPLRWCRGLAILAVALHVASEASVATRAIRRDPAELTRAMRVLYAAPRPPAELNALSWYWATQPDAPAAVLEMARDGMEAAIEERARPAYQDTIATLHYRLRGFDRAAAIQRRAIESGPAPERIGHYVSQLARFEYARLASENARPLADPPLRLRRGDGGAWQLVPASNPPRRALVLSGGRLVGYLELDAEAPVGALRVPAPAEGEGPADGDLAVVPLPAETERAARATRLWWMDPEVAGLP